MSHGMMSYLLILVYKYDILVWLEMFLKTFKLQNYFKFMGGI